MARTPSLSISSVIDTNSETIALTGNSSRLIRYASNVEVTLSVAAYDGASINTNTYVVRNGGQTKYSPAYSINGKPVFTFDGVEDSYFRASVADSNDVYVSASYTANMIEYIPITCNITSIKTSASGTMEINCDGDYYNGSFGASSNSMTLEYRYKKSSGSYSSWYSMAVSISGNTYTASATINGVDTESTYSVQIQAQDKLTVDLAQKNYISLKPIFHWGNNDFVFEVPVDIRQSLRLKQSDMNYGNRIYFGDGSYCYIGEDSNDELTLYASKVNIDSDGGIYLNNVRLTFPESGIWNPTLLDEAVSSYTRCDGWYTRIGDIVTVGFYIKANCYSGYESNEIKISGLPYKPLISASGGGMCSGAYVWSACTFQCFVAESIGNKITVRVQDCDRANNENLGTSASGCFYPQGGGDLTLSGTITYYTGE